MRLDLQKASMWKRISAFLFDAILLSVIAVLMGLAISEAVRYDSYAETVDKAYQKYGEQYGVDLNMSTAEYEALDEEGMKNLTAAYEALNNDHESRHALGMMMELSILIASFGILFGFLILEFIVPLFLKNGQTLGKKIFGICVMHTSFVKISPPMLFARTVLGKFAVETMISVYIIIMMLFGTIGIVGPGIILILLAVQLILMISTNTNSMIHDLIAKTVVVEIGSQMIFESNEELLAFKEKQHEEKARAEKY